MKIYNYKCNIQNDIINKYSICNIQSLQEKNTYADCKILIWSNNHDFKQEFFTRFSQIKVFINWGAATINAPNKKEFESRGIIFHTLKGVCTEAVSEFSIYLILKILNRSSPMRQELFKKSIGIIGMGSIGSRIAETLYSGFNCSIKYLSRTKKNLPSYEYIDHLPSLIESIDILILSIDSKKFSLDVNHLKNRKKTLSIINISRDINAPLLPIVKAIEKKEIQNIDIISDIESSKGLEGYEKFYTSHLAYKTRESIKKKQVFLESILTEYAK